MTDLENQLARLQHLLHLVERQKRMPPVGAEVESNHAELVQTYGEVSDLYREMAGTHVINVPPSGARLAVSIHSNYFEVGFLSGHGAYRAQAKTELAKVIGMVQGRIATEKKALAVLATTTGPRARGNHVFVVHGHDDAVLLACARFLDQAGLPYTILKEQANKGRTVHQKFLDHSDVGFAVVLITADDRGGPAAVGYEAQRPRARQNVVFELGYFVAHLGPAKVCALYEEGVELPSDYDGVLYVPLDKPGAWRYELGRELKAAGLEVDLNKVK